MLEPDAASAGDGDRPAFGRGGVAALEFSIASEDDRRARVTVPRRAFKPVVTPSLTAPAPIRHEAPPIRLDANAVLSLNELFLDPSPWRGGFPGFEAQSPTIQFVEEAAPEPSPIENRWKDAFVIPGSPEAGWFAEHIELSFDDGIAYHQNFTWRGLPLRLKIWGPVLKGDAGLGVRLRGLRLYGHNVEVRSRATTDLQDVQIRIDF